jgi:hypothetical protein
VRAGFDAQVIPPDNALMPAAAYRRMSGTTRPNRQGERESFADQVYGHVGLNSHRRPLPTGRTLGVGSASARSLVSSLSSVPAPRTSRSSTCRARLLSRLRSSGWPGRDDCSWVPLSPRTCLMRDRRDHELHEPVESIGHRRRAGGRRTRRRVRARLQRGAPARGDRLRAATRALRRAASHSRRSGMTAHAHTRERAALDKPGSAAAHWLVPAATYHQHPDLSKLDAAPPSSIGAKWSPISSSGPA